MEAKALSLHCAAVLLASAQTLAGEIPRYSTTIVTLISDVNPALFAFLLHSVVCMVFVPAMKDCHMRVPLTLRKGRSLFHPF